MKQEYYTPCSCSRGYAPSGRTRIEQIWQQLTERAGRFTAPARQVVSPFDQNSSQMAMAAAGVGMYDWNTVRDQHIWSPECKILLGLAPDAREDFAYYRSLIHPEDRERVFSLFTEHYRTKTPHEVEYRIVWPDGSLHWLVDQGRFLYDRQGKELHRVGITRETTALKQTEEARAQASAQLRQHQTFLHTILHQMPVGIIIAQAPSGRILSVNEEALCMLGPGLLTYETYEQYGRMGMWYLDGTAYQAEEYPLARAILFGETVKQEVLLQRRADGHLHPLSTNAAPITDPQGQILAGTMTLQDVSGQYALERQKDAFLCQIGHELRTPLTALKGNLQLTERHLQRWLAAHEASLAEEEQRLLQRISRWNEQALRQVNVENRLIENLLDASALQAAELQVSLESRNLVHVVSTVVKDLQTVMPPRTLFCEACEHADVPVMIDDVRIRQVITQYVKNALYAAAERPPILVGISLGEKAAKVWVKDAGPGLACEQQDAIWQRFHSASGLAGSQCPDSSGARLGLYLCRELIRLHRGETGVESAPGKGSTFWFTLPLREALLSPIS
ncbi:MAG TPA: ATP-binding protein [Ktedonobacteraceae bacterium]|nr:ATP-binding protein [Ktedonobacteraceae bacterium]